MPFNQRFNPETGLKFRDDTLTGPPPPPETGTIVEETGLVVADSDTVVIAPATPVRVTIPGPREPVIDASGKITPRWWRFFEELYRRTGAIEDNINNTSRTLTGLGTTGSVVIASSAPSIQIAHIQAVPVTGLSLSGQSPTISIA